MHATIRALIALDDINRQRQILLKQRSEHQAIIDQAAAVVAKAQAAADQAAEAVGSQDALIRQYTADIERCDKTMAELREKQMTAKSNKDYLACINGVEEAKQEKRLRTTSVEQLQQKVGDLQSAADEAAAALTAAEAKHGEMVEKFAGDAVNESSSGELERLYQEHKAAVDPGFLSHYERLVKAGNRMPLMKLNPISRATPLGNMISTSEVEKVRLGDMVLDPVTSSILYIAED